MTAGHATASFGRIPALALAGALAATFVVGLLTGLAAPRTVIASHPGADATSAGGTTRSASPGGKGYGVRVSIPEAGAALVGAATAGSDPWANSGSGADFYRVTHRR